MLSIQWESPSSDCVYLQVDIENDAIGFALFMILQGSFTAFDTLILYVWFWHRNELEHIYTVFLKSC